MAAIAILGCGAVTPVGFSARQSCAAVRAGLTGFVVTGVRDRSRGPVIRAEVPITPGPDESNPYARLVALGAIALRDCVAASGVDPARSVLLLGVREPFRTGPGLDWKEAALLADIERATNLCFAPGNAAFPEGNAAVFAALGRAREMLVEGRVSACIVGGVDTLLTPADLRRFGAAWRLRSDEVARGFVPGEAAAFLAVTSHTAPGAIAMLRGIGLGREPAESCVLGPRWSTGQGLERALRDAIEDAEITEPAITFRASDLNGEAYRGQENMLAETRVFRTRRAEFSRILPAASVGETGAAAGALAIIAATTALDRDYAPGPAGICHAASDAGLRGACVLVAV